MPAVGDRRHVRVPPHKIGDLDRATFSNIEHQSLDFVVGSLQPWLGRIEGRANGWLLLEQERDRYFAEFLVDGLFPRRCGEPQPGIHTARQWGWLSVNEIRQRENIDPIPDGNVYLQPMNMLQAGLPPRVASQVRSIEAERRPERRSDAAIEEIGRGRQQMAASYRRNIEESAQRLINGKNRQTCTNAAERLGERNRVVGERRNVAEMEAWLDEFYRDFAHVAREYLMPTLQTLVELARDDVRRETGQRWPDDELETWAYNYVDTGPTCGVPTFGIRSCRRCGERSGVHKTRDTGRG